METFPRYWPVVRRIHNSPVTDEFPSQRSVTWIFDAIFDLRLDKRLSKQPKWRWFETQSRSLWRHCNEHSHLEWAVMMKPFPYRNVSWILRCFMTRLLWGEGINLYVDVDKGTCCHLILGRKFKKSPRISLAYSKVYYCCCCCFYYFYYYYCYCCCCCYSSSSSSCYYYYYYYYRKVSNIRRTKSQQLKYSRTVLGLSLPNPLKPDIKSRTKM